jgi:hypothetical protein
MMIRIVLTVLPIITAGLYLIGLAFHQGYLEGFGIEETLFPLSLERTLFQGFVAFLTLGAKPILYSVLAVMVLFISAVIVAVLSSSERVRKWAVLTLNKFKAKKQVKSNIPTWASELIDAIANIFVFIAIIFFLYAALLLVAIFATQSGKEQSIQFIKKATDLKSGYVTVYIENNTDKIIGKPIICGSPYCAYWVSSEVLLLKNDSVSKIVAHNPSIKRGAALTRTVP